MLPILLYVSVAPRLPLLAALPLLVFGPEHFGISIRNTVLLCRRLYLDHALRKPANRYPRGAFS